MQLVSTISVWSNRRQQDIPPEKTRINKAFKLIKLSVQVSIRMCVLSIYCSCIDSYDCIGIVSVQYRYKFNDVNIDKLTHNVMTLYDVSICNTTV